MMEHRANMAKQAAIFPSWVQTVEAMIAEGIEVRAWCDRGCRKGFVVVDLARIRREKGPAYSLINRRSRCRTLGCTGWVKFHYPHGVYRPLFDQATAERWMLGTKKGAPEGAPTPRNL